MDFWDSVQKDIRKNIRDGLKIVRESGAAVSQKIEKLTEEGKRKYRLFALKMKVQEEFAKLGGRVYGLSSKTGNPLADKKVRSVVSRLKKLETRISGLEKKHTAASRKKKPGRVSGKKKIK